VITQYGEFFEKRRGGGASSLKGRRAYPRGGEDPSLARGFRRGDKSV
jgi:hypothetical protein